jgi:hypothetical protein
MITPTTCLCLSTLSSVGVARSASLSYPVQFIEYIHFVICRNSQKSSKSTRSPWRNGSALDFYLILIWSSKGCGFEPRRRCFFAFPFCCSLIVSQHASYTVLYEWVEDGGFFRFFIAFAHLGSRARAVSHRNAISLQVLFVWLARVPKELFALNCALLLRYTISSIIPFRSIHSFIFPIPSSQDDRKSKTSSPRCLACIPNKRFS